MMKKFTLMLVACLFVATTNAQEISTESWTMITKRTATWCPHCGAWGWDMFKNIIDDNADKNVIVWSAHFSGDLENTAAKELISELGGSGQPVFFVNADNMAVNSGNAASKRDEINLYVDDLLAMTPMAGVGVKASYDGTTLTVDAKTEFLTSLSQGDYSLAIYVLKDHVIANQSGQGSNADHRYVLTDALTPTFGESIVSGEIENGATYEITASKDIEIDVDNDQVVAILWNLRSDGDHAFFNANRSAIELTSGTVEAINGIETMTASYQSGSILTQIASQQSSKATLSVFNVSGQEVANQNVELIPGTQSIQIDATHLSSGAYFVRLMQGDKVHTEKVILP